jgi:xanthine/uracil/vitamin C permease (AzgA family)
MNPSNGLVSFLLIVLCSYLTTVYIVIVNSELLSYAGLPREAAAVSTCLVAALGTLLIGLGANLPFVVAPGLGLGAYFVYHLITHLALPYAAAHATVFLAGLVLMVAAAVGGIDWALKPVPRAVKVGLVVGLGLLLCFLGLQIGRFLTLDTSTLVRATGASVAPALVTLTALLLTAGLLHARVPGALLCGVALVALLSLAFPSAVSPAAAVAAAPPKPAWTATLRLPSWGRAARDGPVLHTLSFAALPAVAFAALAAVVIASASDLSSAAYGLERMCGLRARHAAAPDAHRRRRAAAAAGDAEKARSGSFGGEIS